MNLTLRKLHWRLLQLRLEQLLILLLFCSSAKIWPDRSLLHLRMSRARNGNVVVIVVLDQGFLLYYVTLV